MTHKILGPHKEQDGWVYVRVRKGRCVNADDNLYFVCGKPISRLGFNGVGYFDYLPDSRIISSRRVEQAVETHDYLQRCAEEGLAAVFCARSYLGVNDFWMVCRSCGGFTIRIGSTPGGLCEPNVGSIAAHGDTLREAYHRYKAACE